MEILRNIKVPTGNICVMQGEKGKIEFLSVGDYGKNANIKADFLGVTRELNGVPNGEIMPLSEKWVITISTQYGCSMDCKFCDVPKVGKGLNATYYDMLNQIKCGLNLHTEITGTKRLNIHFARMGEPTFNGNVLDVAACLHRNIYDVWQNSGTVHPVVSTMLPKNNTHLLKFLHIWCSDIKNNLYRGDAGLQFSINSTSNKQREEMFSGNSLTLEEISEIGKLLPTPKGRKYALNFALADNYEVDADMIKFRPKPEIKTKFVRVICDSVGMKYYTNLTVFNPTKKQCGKDSLLCSDGYIINPTKPGRVLAMSLDLQTKYNFRYGQKVWVEIDKAPYLNGVYTLHSTNGKKNNVCEILIYNPNVCRVEGSWKGRIAHYYK